MKIEDCEIFVEEVEGKYNMRIILPKDMEVMERLNVFAIVVRQIAKTLETPPIDMPHTVAMWMMGQFIVQDKPVEVILGEILRQLGRIP